MWIHAGGWGSRSIRAATRRSSILCRQRRSLFHAKACRSSFTKLKQSRCLVLKPRRYAGRLDDFVGPKAVARLRRAGKTTAFQKPLPFTSEVGDVTFFGFGSIRVCRARRSVKRKR